MNYSHIRGRFTSMNPKDISYDTQFALHQVCTALNPLLALRAYEENQYVLKDWRIIYAAEDDAGPFKLRRKEFADRGFISTCFRGKSLWVLDSEAISTLSPVRFQMGYGTFVDSNAASFIKALAYRENPSPGLTQYGNAIRANFDNAELAVLNPYLYLWEAQRSWNEETIENCRMTLAAIHALSLDSSPLDESWGLRFRNIYREQAEAHADELLADFQKQLDNGLHEGIEQQVDLVESMILRTKIIEASSSKSAEHKMGELIQFMHEETSTFMLRELIVCADILCRGGRSALSKKLNSVLDKEDPLAMIKNCSWDLYLPRALDAMANTQTLPEADFYLGNLITFDTDVADIFKLTELRAMAMHRKSTYTFPFFNEEFIDWIAARVGEKRMDSLAGLFQTDGFESRAKLRSHARVKNILVEDRARFLSMKKQKR
ncbi:hypothetical protein ALP78_02267 [Pseudomonas coronafaciens pv. striafaciens]|uniref:Uncharacterized protein n=2 Tax=Pseudomonas coronafaciens TaxID=53409 RepID=A0A3M4XWK7_9PSED|nr:hypothetical protein ALP78_02267 [Pseudomonas coronafaciens pv. striafaciens]